MAQVEAITLAVLTPVAMTQDDGRRLLGIAYHVRRFVVLREHDERTAVGVPREVVHAALDRGEDADLVTVEHTCLRDAVRPCAQECQRSVRREPRCGVVADALDQAVWFTALVGNRPQFGAIGAAQRVDDVVAADRELPRSERTAQVFGREHWPCHADKLLP
jgi:hypothetical protein